MTDKLEILKKDYLETCQKYLKFKKLHKIDIDNYPELFSRKDKSLVELLKKKRYVDKTHNTKKQNIKKTENFQGKIIEESNNRKDNERSETINSNLLCLLESKGESNEKSIKKVKMNEPIKSEKPQNIPSSSSHIIDIINNGFSSKIEKKSIKVEEKANNDIDKSSVLINEIEELNIFSNIEQIFKNIEEKNQLNQKNSLETKLQKQEKNIDVNEENNEKYKSENQEKQKSNVQKGQLGSALEKKTPSTDKNSDNKIQKLIKKEEKQNNLSELSEKCNDLKMEKENSLKLQKVHSHTEKKSESISDPKKSEVNKFNYNVLNIDIETNKNEINQTKKTEVLNKEQVIKVPDNSKGETQKLKEERTNQKFLKTNMKMILDDDEYPINSKETLKINEKHDKKINSPKLEFKGKLNIETSNDSKNEKIEIFEKIKPFIKIEKLKSDNEILISPNIDQNIETKSKLDNNLNEFAKKEDISNDINLKVKNESGSPKNIEGIFEKIKDNIVRKDSNDKFFEDLENLLEKFTHVKSIKKYFGDKKPKHILNEKFCSFYQYKTEKKSKSEFFFKVRLLIDDIIKFIESFDDRVFLNEIFKEIIEFLMLSYKKDEYKLILPQFIPTLKYIKLWIFLINYDTNNNNEKLISKFMKSILSIQNNVKKLKNFLSEKKIKTNQSHKILEIEDAINLLTRYYSFLKIQEISKILNVLLDFDKSK